MEAANNFYSNFHIQIISTIVLIFLMIFIKFFVRKIVMKYASKAYIQDSKAIIIIKLFNIIINFLFIILLITIWGVNPKNVFLTFSSIFAIIGVAFFAQWSLLSNITAGFIIYFTTPFRIGDFIRIDDKDFPLEATVEDIKTFFIYLKTKEGESVVIPNSLILQKTIAVKSKTNGFLG